jgi:hypothetical protein
MYVISRLPGRCNQKKTIIRYTNPFTIRLPNHLRICRFPAVIDCSRSPGAPKSILYVGAAAETASVVCYDMQCIYTH